MKLEKAKEIIRENFQDARCGIFASRNVCGDLMTCLYEGDGLSIYICYDWEYFEVFGLYGKELDELIGYYDALIDTEK